MADQRITELTDLPIPALEDVLAIVDDPSGSPITKKVTLQNVLVSVLADGWVPLIDTLTYVSASTFTVSGDQTAKYQKGTRLKLTQTTVKYFVVLSASYNSGTGLTTVTVTGGIDYTLANAVITSPYYSYQQNPQGYPGWFNFTTTFGGFSADPSGGTKKFKIDGTTCSLTVYGMSNGTSNATTTTLTVPVAPATAQEFGGTIQVNDASAFKSGYIQIATSTTLSLFTAFFQTAWTNSGNKNFYIPVTSYEF